jgi:pimeloyl-ACP methyl ester carboxylesterase
MTINVAIEGVGPIPVEFHDQGHGHAFLLLHGGAGPQSVAGFADLLATSQPARVLVPVHPGFDGSPRPAGLDSIKGLAAVYTALLDKLELADVTVVGNSIGGWIATEMALRDSPRISSVVLVDSVGLAVDGHPIADFFSLTMDEVAGLSYYRPDAFRIDVDALPDAQKARMAGNREALRAYGGTAMSDPGLLERLPHITIPTLVVWGAADRIVPPEHAEAYASGIPGARVHLIENAGHLPQIEAPEELLPVVWEFAESHSIAL